MNRHLLFALPLLLSVAHVAEVKKATTFRGEIVCVPARGGGEQTAMCMIGFKSNGKYYILQKLDPMDVVKLPMNSPVIIKGRMVPAPKEQSGRYDTADAIEVTSWKKVVR